MKYLAVLFSFLILLIALAVVGFSSDQSTTAKSVVASPAAVAHETERVYPIAPGVWYPGQPMPEKPMRYYRVRCWPGCHSGSDYGKYPDKPLKMKPIYQTSTVRAPQ
ncbi:MAG: hypothetical protein P8X68_07700 [Desulfobacterales bacterium]|jgi:hypothetical protein